MRKGLVWCFLIVLLAGIGTVAWADAATPGAELIQKGTFEESDMVVGNPPASPWVVAAPTGSSVKVNGDQSPFPPAGSKNVLMEDNSTDSVVTLKQPFAEQSSVFLLLSVDVKLADATAQLAIRLGKETAGSESVYLLLSDSEGLRAVEGAGGVEKTLVDGSRVNTGTWYRIQAMIPGTSSGLNPSRLYRVSLEPYGGNRIVSETVVFAGVDPSPDVTRTGKVYVDNVSLRVMQDGTAPAIVLGERSRRKVDAVLTDAPGEGDVGAYGLAMRVVDADAVDHAGGYDAAAGVFGVDNPGKFAVGDVVRVGRTGELLRVTAVDNGNKTITVIRGWAGSTPAAVNDNEPLSILGISCELKKADGTAVAGSFSWSDPDQKTLVYEKTISFVPEAPLAIGNYKLIVTAADQAGNRTENRELTFTVANAAPTADFTSSMTGVNTITFTDKSTDDVQVTAWHWEFGDGATSDEQNPVHTYPDKGVYQVKLTVTDTDGATSSVTKSVNLEKVQLEVDLREPAGGETWIGGVRTIKWTARHPEGGNMWFTLQYSYDGGATWKDIVTDLNVRPDNAGNYTYQWDVSKVVRGSDKFKVKLIAEGTGANPAEDESGIFTVIAVEKGKVSTGPNPARNHATFYYDLGSGGAQVRNGGSVSATLYIYDLSGRPVFTRELPVGSNSFTWDLVNMHGEPVASGLYLWQINLPDGGAIGPKRLIVAR